VRPAATATVYLKSVGAGIFNLIFAGVVVLYFHMAVFEARFHSESKDASHWDPFSVSPVWWVVLSILIFTASFYKEFRKLTRKPNL
jgi:hypothetical protein